MANDDFLVSSLEQLLGKNRVLTDGAALEDHAGDALDPFRAFDAAPRLRARPAAVALPTTTQEVSALVRWAAERRVPLVPCGGGTGVMGAATAVDGCVVVDMTRMARILSVSAEDRLAEAEPGVVLGDLDAAMGGHGLMLGHDPWSQPIATVGGAISTGSVGYLAARYGPMGAQVVGIEAVLPSGEVVTTRPVPKAAGIALHHLFIGAEGTLGIITRAWVRAFPRPEARRILALRFPDFEAGFKSVEGVYAAGLRPSVIDMAEEPEQGESAAPETELYLGFEGPAEVVQAETKLALGVCGRSGAEDMGAEAANGFWASRHAVAERYMEARKSFGRRRARPPYAMDYLHVALPASRVLAYRHRCQEILAGYPVFVREWSLWAWPELFSLLMVNRDDTPPEAARPEMGRAADRILALAQDMGGSMEYCHGVGLKLAHLWHRELGSQAALFRSIKRALDPVGIMNPGRLPV